MMQFSKHIFRVQCLDLLNKRVELMYLYILLQQKKEFIIKGNVKAARGSVEIVWKAQNQ